MPVQDIPFVIGVIAAFALFGITLAYVNLIAGARATTFEQERAARMATRAQPETPARRPARDLRAA